MFTFDFGYQEFGLVWLNFIYLFLPSSSFPPPFFFLPMVPSNVNANIA